MFCFQKKRTSSVSLDLLTSKMFQRKRTLQFSNSKEGLSFRAASRMGYFLKTDTLTDMTEMTDIRLIPYRKKVLKNIFFYKLFL